LYQRTCAVPKGLAANLINEVTEEVDFPLPAVFNVVR